MRKIGLIFGGCLMVAATIALISEAWAACPAGTRYTCYQGANGRVICSCS